MKKVLKEISPKKVNWEPLYHPFTISTSKWNLQTLAYFGVDCIFL